MSADNNENNYCLFSFESKDFISINLDDGYQVRFRLIEKSVGLTVY